MGLFKKEYSKEQIILEGYVSRLKNFKQMLKTYPTALPRIWSRYMDVKSKFKNFKNVNTNTSKQVVKLMMDCDSLIKELDEKTNQIMNQAELKIDKSLQSFERTVNQYETQNGMNKDFNVSKEEMAAEEKLNKIMMRDALVRGDNETYQIYAEKNNARSR